MSTTINIHSVTEVSIEDAKNFGGFWAFDVIVKGEDSTMTCVTLFSKERLEIKGGELSPTLPKKEEA